MTHPQRIQRGASAADPTHGRDAVRGPAPTASLLARAAVGALLLGVAASCSDDDDPTSEVRTPTLATFSPSAGLIPTPNDLLFSGSTDATLNIPITDPMMTSDPSIALNTVDGWSTGAPITIPFTRPLDPATVIGESTVRVFEVTDSTAMAPVGGPVVSVDAELTDGVDYEIDLPAAYGGTTIEIQPLRLLTPSTSGANSVYMVVVTDGVTDTEGVAVARDAEYRFASEPTLGPGTPASLAQLNALVNAQLNAYTAFTMDPREDVVVSFTFTVQSLGTALNTVFGIANGQESAIISNLCAILGTCGADTAPSPFSDPTINQVNNPSSELGSAQELLGLGPGGNSRVFAGILKVPYYLTQSMNTAFAAVTTDPSAISIPWQSRYAAVAGSADRNLTRFNPLPTATSCQQIPILISIPTGAAPMGGWPIAIFQHGIGRNRTDMLGVAEALAAVDVAVVAMDLPLHGVAFNDPLPDGTDIFVGYNNMLPDPDDVWERTFGIDFLDESGAVPVAGPDGVADSSGAHFINPQNLAVTRDNLRQSVADLINLRAALDDLTILGSDVIDESEVHLIGYSLGGIVGTPFLAFQSDLTAATLGMPGGHLTYLLDGSVGLGPVLRGQAAAAGIQAGTPEYEQFLWAGQTVVDAADPINYGALAATVGTPTYLIEIVGDGMALPPDLVIPNSVAGRPFAGTEPLITSLGLSTISATTNDPMGVRGAVRFTAGNHGTLLTPSTTGMPTAEELAAYAEMQAQLAGFHQTDGQTLTVTDPTVVQ